MVLSFSLLPFRRSAWDHMFLLRHQPGSVVMTSFPIGSKVVSVMAFTARVIGSKAYKVPPG